MLLAITKDYVLLNRNNVIDNSKSEVKEERGIYEVVRLSGRLIESPFQDSTTTSQKTDRPGPPFCMQIGLYAVVGSSPA